MDPWNRRMARMDDAYNAFGLSVSPEDWLLGLAGEHLHPTGPHAPSTKHVLHEKPECKVRLCFSHLGPVLPEVDTPICMA